MAVRLVDVDREARPEVESEVASARVDPQNLGRLPSIEAEGGESGMLRAFLHDRGLEGTEPRFNLRGDVQGDAQPERIIVVDTYVLAMGPGFRDGDAYDIFQLPITTAADVRAGRLVDLTGDGKKELALTIRQHGGGGSRDLWHTFSFAGGHIRPQFGIEVRKETHEGFVEAEVNVRRARRGPALIVASAGRAHGLSPETFREARATEVEAILLPWGPISERVYQWDGSRFATLRETENPRARRETQPRERRPPKHAADAADGTHRADRPGDDRGVQAPSRFAGKTRGRTRASTRTSRPGARRSISSSSGRTWSWSEPTFAGATTSSTSRSPRRARATSCPYAPPT